MNTLNVAAGVVGLALAVWAIVDQTRGQRMLRRLLEDAAQRIDAVRASLEREAADGRALHRALRAYELLAPLRCARHAHHQESRPS